MWSYINRKLRSRDKDNYVLNEREKFMKRNEELQNQAISVKKAHLASKREEWFEEYHRGQKLLRNPLR